MKKKYFTKLLSAVMSVVMLCGVLSPMMASATASNAYTSGLQKFLDDGNHTQLVDCPDAVYMEYANQLRTNPKAELALFALGLIYGGADYKEKIEPNKDLYKQVLLNIIRTYEAENAEAITQQSLLDDTKSLEDYLHDVADIGLSWLSAADTNIKLETGEGVIPEDVSLAVSIINQIPKDAEDWTKGACTLKTTLQLYEKHDIFLRTVEENAEGTLKEAASELRIDQSKVVKAHLRAYGDLAMDSAEDYAKLFVDGIWAEDWIDYIKDKLPFSIPKVFSRAFQGATLGVEIGKLVGNLSVGAEDVMAYILEIKAVYDISVILENEMNGIKNTLQKDSSKVTETDVQHYIAYGNYLISSRIRGQYCMTAIYLQPSLRNLLSGETAKNAEVLYNRLTNNLLSIKKKLDAIMDGDASASSTVVDAVNYEKDVITDPSLVGIWEPQGIKHQIRIPKVSLNTTSAQMFNQKIYSNHCYGYELLLSNQEANKIFDCTYEYKVYKSVVAVAVLDGFAVQAGGGSLSYKVYYYSLDKDQELTFDEYLDAVGITYDTVLSRIMDTNAYKEEMQYAWEPITNMTDCLLDEEGTTAFFENIATMDGWSEIKTSSVISSVPSNEFSWEFDQTTGTVTISGTGSMKDYHCDHDPAPWDKLGYDDLLKHMVIEDGITEIGSFTFAFVDETVTIPKSVTKIRAGAFADAWNLQTIYYQGTESEWANIEIYQAGNGELENVNIIYLGNGD